MIGFIKSRFKNKFFLFGVFIGLAITMIVISYVFNFYDSSLSKDPADWGAFGDYMGGLLNPVIGIASIIILGYISIMLGKDSTDKQKEMFNIQQRTLAYNELVNEFSEFTKASDLIKINAAYLRNKNTTKMVLEQSDIMSIIKTFSSFSIMLTRFPIFYGHLFEEQHIDQHKLKSIIEDLNSYIAPFLYPKEKSELQFDEKLLTKVRTELLNFFETLQTSVVITQ